MLHDDNSGFKGFGGFDGLPAGTVRANPGTYYGGRPDDEWDNWCNLAADYDPRRGPDEAPKWRKWCVDGNQMGFTKHWGQPPWTVLGHTIRGLPQDFSTVKDRAGTGTWGALTNAVTGGGGAVSGAQEAVTKAQQAVSTVQQVVNPTPTPVVQPYSPPAVRPTVQTGFPMPGAQYFSPATKSKLPLILAGVGLAAVGGFLLLKKRKSGGSVAGFGGFRRKIRRSRK